jgi:virulence factor
MKIGIVGLGDIANKAYLPVLSDREDIELVLCTRNEDTLRGLAKKYRIKYTASTVEKLIKEGVEAAFISAATDAHYDIAQKLLGSGINVYIDKPISTSFQETAQVVTLAKSSGKIAMVGFNRRFIPMVKELKEKGKANIIIMQKNRFSLPGHVRSFVLDDFIHVVDTLRFLMDTEVLDLKVQYLRKEDMLHNIVIQLIGEECTAIGIMNRDSGAAEESIEYMTQQHKYVINGLVETTHLHNKEISIRKSGDWEPTLYKRGFYQIVDHFIDCVKNNKTPNPSIEDSLITHEICEKIVKLIEKKSER